MSRNFQLRIIQVQNPILGNAGAGVEKLLATTVEGERAIGDLHDQYRRRGMCVAIVAH